jgi:chitinase
MDVDNSAGYIAMIQQLRMHFQSASKPYIITGAPQCVVPDGNMEAMIKAVQFDITWVQFYNTPQCSVTSWINANPNYSQTQIEQPSGFSYNTWSSFLTSTASANAKLYIGVQAANTDYITPAKISMLIEAYYCKPNFGGIMIWEATLAENNTQYYSTVKEILNSWGGSNVLSCNKQTTTLSTIKSTMTKKITTLTSIQKSMISLRLTTSLKTSTTLTTMSEATSTSTSSGTAPSCKPVSTNLRTVTTIITSIKTITTSKLPSLTTPIKSSSSVIFSSQVPKPKQSRKVQTNQTSS